MGSLGHPELSLDCRLLTRGFLAEVSSVHGASDKISKLEDCANRLRDEMKKIDAFKRELPLCMLLLNHAISAINEELMQLKKSNAEPVLEEFIPLKKSSDDEKDEQVENPYKEKEDNINTSEKMSWMSSVQLWNSDNQHHNPNTDLSGNNIPLSFLDNNKKRKAEELGRPTVDDLFQIGKNRTARRVFVPFKKCDELQGVPGLSLSIPETKNAREVIFPSGFSSKSSSTRSGSSSATIVQSSCKAGQQHGASRKQRRCWSPELHRRFVAALQQLGGPQVATPKQIRELMQVDGLTNDEVKSHLQKYRLHTRKAPQTMNTATAQPAVLGKLFMSSQKKYGKCSKPSNSHSGSPQGPLHSNGSDIMEDEDEDDE